jgi:hypothetical protein
LWLDFLNIEDATMKVPEELFGEAATREALGYL